MAEDVNKEEESSASERTVPYSRFKEVNEKAKITEQELQTLKSKQPEILTPEEQKEKQAKNFLKKLVKEQLKEEADAKKATETKKQKEFESNVNDALAINTSIDRAEFLKFIEKDANKYGITTVKGAMKLYKDMNKIKDDTTDEVKENLSNKPRLPKSKGVADTTPDYSGDKEKTYDQVVSEIIEEAEGQGRK